MENEEKLLVAPANIQQCWLSSTRVLSLMHHACVQHPRYYWLASITVLCWLFQYFWIRGEKVRKRRGIARGWPLDGNDDVNGRHRTDSYTRSQANLVELPRRQLMQPTSNEWHLSVCWCCCIAMIRMMVAKSRGRSSPPTPSDHRQWIQMDEGTNKTITINSEWPKRSITFFHFEQPQTQPQTLHLDSNHS